VAWHILLSPGLYKNRNKGHKVQQRERVPVPIRGVPPGGQRTTSVAWHIVLPSAVQHVQQELHMQSRNMSASAFKRSSLNRGHQVRNYPTMTTPSMFAGSIVLCSLSPVFLFVHPFSFPFFFVFPEKEAEEDRE